MNQEDLCKIRKKNLVKAAVIKVNKINDIKKSWNKLLKTASERCSINE